VNDSSSPKPRKLASTTQKPPDWNSAATSVSLEGSENPPAVSAEGAAAAGAPPYPARRTVARDSIGT
jgi:hypothetical protein